MSKKIKLIIGSTRQGRVGKPLSDWLLRAAKDSGHDIEVFDLQEIDLPPFDAAVPPAYKPTETPEGKAWAQMVGDADGFVFVTPEYNRSIPSGLKNAIDYLTTEWKEKPAAIVSYGYIDGGKSAAKHLQDIFDWLKIKNVGQEMAILFNQQTFAEDGQFVDVDTALGGIKDDFKKSLQSIEEA